MLVGTESMNKPSTDAQAFPMYCPWPILSLLLQWESLFNWLLQQNSQFFVPYSSGKIIFQHTHI